MPIHKKPLFRQGYVDLDDDVGDGNGSARTRSCRHICVSSEYVLAVGFVFNCSFRNTIFFSVFNWG